MKKLLITGFEPFDNEKINPSFIAVESLGDQIGDYSVSKLRLPVVFGLAAEKVLAAAEDLKPDVILCIGQAGGRDAITPEAVAINLRHGRIPDNSGYKPNDEPIIEGGCAAYFSTLPVRKIAESIEREGIAARVSYSAGVYVCNDLLYLLLRNFENTKTRVGFIHVPYCTAQQKEPSMDIETIIKALEIAIESI